MITIKESGKEAVVFPAGDSVQISDGKVVVLDKDGKPLPDAEGVANSFPQQTVKGCRFPVILRTPS